MLAKFKLIVIFILFWEICLSQIGEPKHTVFNTNNGLPSSEIYCALQDKKGYLWFSSDRGVSRFNGYEFENFTTKEGLLNNVVFKMHEDHKGRIWFINMNGELTYFLNEKIHPYRYNNLVKKILPQSKITYSFHIDSSSNIYIGTAGAGLFKISTKGVVKRIGNISSKNVISYRQIGNTWVSFRIHDNPEDVNYSYQINNLNIPLTQIEKSVRTGSLVRSEVIKLSEEIICFNQAFEVILFNCKENKIIQRIKYNNRITSFSASREKELFVGLDSKGAHFYRYINNGLEEQQWILKNNTISSCIRDRNAGYWITTIQNGIYYVPNFDVNSFTEKNGLAKNYISQLLVNQQDLYISLGKEIQIFNKNKALINTKINEGNTNSESFNNQFYQDDCFLKLRTHKLIDVCNDIIYPNKIQSGIPVVKRYRDNYYLFSKAYGSTFNTESKTFTKIKLNKDVIPINDVVMIDEYSFWIASNNGLFKYENKKTRNMSHLSSLLNTRIIDIAKSEQFELIVATRENGVILLKKGRIINITSEHGLNSNDINSVYIDSLQNIWVGTNNGLNKINNQNIYQIESYTTEEGLINDEIREINRVDNNLFIGTKRGLSIIDLNKSIKKNSDLKVEIANIELNGKRRNKSSVIDIYSGDKFFKLEYIAILPSALGNIDYKYRIKEISSEWQYKKSRHIKIETFPEEGTYTIEIYAKLSSSNQWSKVPLIIHLNFHPPFYKRTSFQLSVAAIILLLIYIAFRIDLLRYNKQIQQELFNRLLKLLNKKSYLVIELNKSVVRINENHILYIEAFKDYIEIHTIKKKFLYRYTMKKMESKLPSNKFVRVHRSYIIQKDKIDGISKDFIVIQGKKIPFGKTYKSIATELFDTFSRVNN